MLKLEVNCIQNQAKQRNYFDAIISNFTPYNYIKKLKEKIYFKNRKDHFNSKKYK